MNNYIQEIEKIISDNGLKISRRLKGYELDGYVNERRPDVSGISVNSDGSWKYNNIRLKADIIIPLQKKGKGYTDRGAMKHMSSQKCLIWEVVPNREMAPKEFYSIVSSIL